MKHTLTALLRDHPGALNRTVSLFRRRGFNIDTLHIVASGGSGVSRMTLVVEADDISRVIKQMNRLIDVLQVEVLPTTGD